MLALFIIFIGLYCITPYIEHNLSSIMIGYTIPFIIGGYIFQYLDTHTGPWTHKKIHNNSNNIIPFNKVLPTVITNIAIGNISSYYYIEYLENKRGFSSSEENLLTVCYQFLQLFFIYDIIFFTFHYIIHIPLLYKLIHKKHHLTFGNMAITGHYMTVSDYFLEILVPFWLSVYIINPCFKSTFIFSVVGQINGLITHSGYKFYGLSNPEYHCSHHTKNNINYGSGGLSKLLN